MIPVILHNIYLPLSMGKIVVAERYILDAIVSIAYFIGRTEWLKDFLCGLMFRFIPRRTIFIYLNCPYTEIRRRRGKESEKEHYYRFQQILYNILSKRVGAYEIDTSTRTIGDTARCIYRYVTRNLSR